MLELGSCSVSSQSLTGDHNALGLPRATVGPECPVVGLGVGAMCSSSTPRHHILPSSPSDCESWQKHRTGLAGGSSLFSESHSLLEPQSLSTSYDTLYLPHMSGQAPLLHPNRLGLSLDVGSTFEVGGGMLGVDGDLAVSPNVIKRRRGGLIEQRDIVKAHQAHKIQSTPQARRKEWEWVWCWYKCRTLALSFSYLLNYPDLFILNVVCITKVFFRAVYLKSGAMESRKFRSTYKAHSMQKQTSVIQLHAIMSWPFVNMITTPAFYYAYYEMFWSLRVHLLSMLHRSSCFI